MFGGGVFGFAVRFSALSHNDKKIALVNFFSNFSFPGFFLSISPAFFDGPEYIKLFSNTLLRDSLKQVHYPIHPLFVVIGWLFNQIPFGDTLSKVEFLNVILGFWSIFLLYQIFQMFLGQKKALIITLFASFTPYFWLSQINLMYEPMMGLFLTASFYFLARWVRDEKIKFAHFSSLFFIISFLVSSTSLLYLMFFLGFLLTKKGLRVTLKWIVILWLYLFPSFGLYFVFLKLRSIPSENIFLVLTSANGILAKFKIEGLMFFVRLVRNSLVVYFSFLTLPLGIILFVSAAADIFSKKNRLIILGWLLSFLLLNSFWHAGMYGRLTLFLTLVPLTFLSRIKNQYLSLGLLMLLIIYSSKIVLPYHFQETPYLLEKSFLETLTRENPLLIVSNYEEPFLCDSFSCLVLNSPKTDLPEIKRQIDSALVEKRKVLFTSQGMSAPYFQYDGRDYQILSKRKNHPRTEGQDLVENYQYMVIKEWSEYKLKIFSLFH